MPLGFAASLAGALIVSRHRPGTPAPRQIVGDRRARQGVATKAGERLHRQHRIRYGRTTAS
ncbi:MAG: hypothetical protein R3F11_02490 [Verrucomicrobiales bacterium]